METLIPPTTVLRAVGHLLTYTLHRQAFLLCAVLTFPEADLLALLELKHIVWLVVWIISLHHEHIIIRDIGILNIRVNQ